MRSCRQQYTLCIWRNCFRKCALTSLNSLTHSLASYWPSIWCCTVSDDLWLGVVVTADHTHSFSTLLCPAGTNWNQLVPSGSEVFTLPPYSIWIPHGICFIPCGIHVEFSTLYGICFGWDLTHFGISIPPGFHMEWWWNDQIPHGMMECPYGFHME